MKVTPLRRQYLRVKQKYPETIVFFRLGDFYETFDEDARVTSRELDIVLTSREMGKGQKVPLAGIPHHAVDNYLARLINRGYKVAICEQLSPPGKGLVERDVIRVVTPGTVVETNLLESRSNNYLVSVIVEGEQAGIAYVDITTSEFAVTQLGREKLVLELDRLQTRELLMPEGDAYSIEEIPADELYGVMAVVKKVGQAIKNGLAAAGYNINLNNDPVAGQIIPHLHFHIIPRQEGDDLKLWPQGEYGDGEAEEIVKKVVKFIKL